MLKKILLQLIICLYFASGVMAKQAKYELTADIEKGSRSIDDINVNYEKEIKRIKINILEPCEVEKIKNDLIKIVAKNEEESSSFPEDHNSDLNREGDYRLLYKKLTKDHDKIMNSIFKTIFYNLESTQLFDVQLQKGVCYKINNFLLQNTESDVADFILSSDANGADYVMNVNIARINDKSIKFEIFAWDLLDRRFIDGQYFIINKDNWFRASNIISDFIYRMTTKESIGLFDSKILYIAETGTATNRTKKVSIMNFDGSNNIKITDGKNLTITPIFSKRNKYELFYMQYVNNTGYIYRHNLQQGYITRIAIGQDMTFAPDSNPVDGNEVVVSGSFNGATNLYLLNLKNGEPKKLTFTNYINTAPSYSPDGKKIVYVSDKGGARKLYIMNLVDGKIEKLSKGAGTYDRPSWSPDGKLIAFIKLQRGKFKLGLMTPDGENERYLTEDYLLEGVRWSPNSRYLIYTKQKGAYGEDSIPKLYIMDILTNYEFKLPIPAEEGASDPDWIMNG